MLGRRHRFHGYGAVRRLYDHSTVVRGPLLQLRYRNNNAERPYRVAVVVSRKVHKSAVVRNRIRRRIYELIRINDQTVPAGCDIVVSVYSDAVAELPAAKLQQSVIDMLQKIDTNPSKTP